MNKEINEFSEKQLINFCIRNNLPLILEFKEPWRETIIGNELLKEIYSKICVKKDTNI